MGLLNSPLMFPVANLGYLCRFFTILLIFPLDEKYTIVYFIIVRNAYLGLHRRFFNKMT